MRLVLWRSRGSRRGAFGSRVSSGLGPGGRCRGVVLLETAVFVLATGAAVTRLVASRSCTNQNRHWERVYLTGGTKRAGSSGNRFVAEAQSRDRIADPLLIPHRASHR